MSYVKIFNNKSIHAAYSKMCPLNIKDKYISHWKCIIFYCSNFPPVKKPYEETQDNIDMPNIKYHIYKEVANYAIHGQIPLDVTSWCDLCQ